MPQIQHGLTPAEYLSFRERHLPAHPKIIFVLESPPKSGLYFYKPGAVSEPLFSAMMKDVLEIKPKTKEEGLSEFAFRGFLLIDATYKPVNHPHLSQKERNEVILKDSPLLLEELQKFADPETKVVFVKANVFRLLEPKVTDAGFVVLNRGMKIPFPSTGQQKKFREAVRQVLGLGASQRGRSWGVHRRRRAFGIYFAAIALFGTFSETLVRRVVIKTINRLRRSGHHVRRH